MRNFVLCLLLCLATVAGADDVVFLDFGHAATLEGITQNNVDARLIKHHHHRMLQVDFGTVDWPNIYFSPKQGVWDWSAYCGISVALVNPGAAPIDTSLRVDNAGADGLKHCNTGNVSVPAKGKAQLEVRFLTPADSRFWGMRGVPAGPRASQGADLNPAQVTAFQVFLTKPDQPQTLLIRDIRLIKKEASAEVTLPFIDKFGQYMHADWPGKLDAENDFAKRRANEERSLRRYPELRERDKFQGWAGGPKLEATGWFRTQKTNDKWWLVTPEGHLFLSIGMNCVHPGDSTFVDGRDGWFQDLPAPEDPRFGSAFGQTSGAHSMADIIGGKGRVYNFYQANLIRKYGQNWRELWQDTAYARLRAWGFTTVGNWSNVLDKSPLPFIVTVGSGSCREIEGARGYWGHMRDVFDPEWPAKLDEATAYVEKLKENPLVIGYFVDNELSWETVRAGTLASPPDQPCRQALIADLQAKYSSLEKLNEAWATSAASWDELRAPEEPNATCAADLDAFEYKFALKYFQTIRDALRRHDPHHLYLGCRFATTPPIAVKACAEVADVISFNRYTRTIKSGNWIGMRDLGKPVIVGEFHFGALDRGMFHTGLVRAKNQRERAQMYINYVRSIVDCPAFVGCHWFQYMDQPTTGRSLDGENYNIGFVTITDTPYAELTAAAKKVHAEMYPRRFGK